MIMNLDKTNPLLPIEINDYPKGDQTDWYIQWRENRDKYYY